MACQKIKNYYDLSRDKATRDDLVFAASISAEPKVAIDCGCGAGSDIAFLSEQGFTVHAFDIDEESIKRCQKRFEGFGNVFLCQDSFTSFSYMNASLIVADASLFFCAESEFDSIWKSLQECLVPDGIFCGSFLGPEDTMANPALEAQNLWSDTLVLNENQVRDKFFDFQLLRFDEHKLSGTSLLGEAHDWHIYSVVARKLR